MSRRKVLTALFCAAGMLVLILDSKTALQGAGDGLALCLRSVIPSLFPFLILSSLLTGTLAGTPIPLLRPFGALCGIPKGAESLLAVGLLGGYPVGAQCITQAYRAGQLSKDDSIRLLGFCSNAGPAFIFGMTGSLFSSPIAPWALWLIHIISSLSVGTMLPCSGNPSGTLSQGSRLTIANAVQGAVKSIGMICGWVVVFRVIISFCERWFLWLLPKAAALIFSGAMELTNGCISLGEVDSEGLRFIFCGCFLSFGGLCVWMQTVSVTGELGTGLYLPGKIMQCAVSFLLCWAVQPLIFPSGSAGISPLLPLFTAAFLCIILVYLRKQKKTVAFPGAFVYNGSK